MLKFVMLKFIMVHCKKYRKDFAASTSSYAK